MGAHAKHNKPKEVSHETIDQSKQGTRYRIAVSIPGVVLRRRACILFSTYSVFLSSKGFNLLEINLINCFFMAGVFLMEVPTGAYADVLGRKHSFVSACFILALGMFVYYAADSFWACVLAELIAAIGTAFYSGALEAWVVDSLKHEGMRGELHTLFRRERYMAEAGIIGGSLFGAYIARYDLALPWLCGGISLFVLGLVSAYIMREEYFQRSKATVDLSAFRAVIAESVRYGVRRKSVLHVVIFSTVIVMCVQSLNMQWQIRFQDFGYDTGMLGWIFAGISLFVMLGSFLSRKFMQLVGNEKRALILSQCITVVGILGASIALGPPVVLPAFFLHEIGRGMISPLKRAYMNKRIPSKQRATIISFDSMITYIGAFVGLIVGGGLAEAYSINAAWVASGIVLGAAIPIFLQLKNGDG